MLVFHCLSPVHACVVQDKKQVPTANFVVQYARSETGKLHGQVACELSVCAQRSVIGAARKEKLLPPCSRVKLFPESVVPARVCDAVFVTLQARTYGADQWWVLLEKKGVGASGGAGANVEVGAQSDRVEPKRAPGAMKKSEAATGSEAPKMRAASQKQASKGKSQASKGKTATVQPPPR
jgi:hypothetical protein